MNQISIEWGHFPDTPIFTARVHGITHEQLRHYASRCGFREFHDDDLEAVLLGSSHGQKDDLLCTLEAAGYDIVGVEFVCALDRGEASQ